jgi:hypothetical protein
MKHATDPQRNGRYQSACAIASCAGTMSGARPLTVAVLILEGVSWQV